MRKGLYNTAQHIWTSPNILAVPTFRRKLERCDSVRGNFALGCSCCIASGWWAPAWESRICSFRHPSSYITVTHFHQSPYLKTVCLTVAYFVFQSCLFLWFTVLPKLQDETQLTKVLKLCLLMDFYIWSMPTKPHRFAMELQSSNTFWAQFSSILLLYERAIHCLLSELA